MQDDTEKKDEAIEADEAKKIVDSLTSSSCAYIESIPTQCVKLKLKKN